MREKLIELIGQVQDEGRDYSDVVCVYPTSNKRLADYLIANGVTIPVRCKDCKYMEKTTYGLRWCNVWEAINGMGDDGFCNYGERRTDGN